MHKQQNISFVLSICVGLLSASAFAESPQPEDYPKQKVQKLEGDENRYQQLKKDADLRGRTEMNKGNFDTEVPRGEGEQYPPAQTPDQSK
ncbi:MAG: hypothetical protein ACWA6R_11115 [Nitrosomonas sp.]